MAAATDVKVPDIGDFKDVPVIEVLVKPGDTVKAEDSLVTLGTDGFGRSDYRVKLRKFFEANRHYVTVAALKALADDGAIKADVVEQAIKKYGLDTERRDPWTV